MNETLQFLIQHGYIVLFAWVFAEQMGLPLPAVPLLLAAGALTGAGQLTFTPTFLLTIIASLVADTFWYQLGRQKGGSVLSLLCRISLNPDSCVRHTATFFSRHGAKSLLVAKFVPGISTIAPPLAGILRMPLSRFLLFDVLGACLWVGLPVGLGYLFSDQIVEISDSALRLGTALLGIVVGGLAAYIGWKYVQRRRFLGHLRMARITPEELKKKLDAGEGLMILDVRHALEYESEPKIIPGASFIPVEELEKDPPSISRDQEVVLYCN